MFFCLIVPNYTFSSSLDIHHIRLPVSPVSSNIFWFSVPLKIHPNSLSDCLMFVRLLVLVSFMSCLTAPRVWIILSSHRKGTRRLWPEVPPIRWCHRIYWRQELLVWVPTKKEFDLQRRAVNPKDTTGNSTSAITGSVRSQHNSFGR